MIDKYFVLIRFILLYRLRIRGIKFIQADLDCSHRARTFWIRLRLLIPLVVYALSFFLSMMVYLLNQLLVIKQGLRFLLLDDRLSQQYLFRLRLLRLCNHFFWLLDKAQWRRRWSLCLPLWLLIIRLNQNHRQHWKPICSGPWVYLFINLLIIMRVLFWIFCEKLW
jgi:hypothetical protein